jgi:hypothetical protein
MFAEDIESVARAYGKNLFGYDGKKAIDVDKILDDVRVALEEDQPEFLDWDAMGTADLEDYLSYLNPEKIVDSAEAWDDPEFVEWFVDRFVEKEGIQAVLTNDGAVVFDEKLIDYLGELQDYQDTYF